MRLPVPEELDVGGGRLEVITRMNAISLLRLFDQPNCRGFLTLEHICPHNLKLDQVFIGARSWQVILYLLDANFLRAHLLL